MSNSKTNELFILVNMEFMSKIFTIIYMALGLASWWCVCCCHCWMYTGVTFVIAVRTLCSPTTTPSDLSSPLRVHQPYAGPTYKLQLFILYWTTCTLRPGKGIMSSWRFVKWSIHKRNWKSFWVKSSPDWSSGALSAKEVLDLPGHQWLLLDNCMNLSLRYKQLTKIIL